MHWTLQASGTQVLRRLALREGYSHRGSAVGECVAAVSMRSLPFLRSMPRSLLFWLVLLVSLVPFWPPLSILFQLALRNERYTHILFVPFISLCVFYFERKAILPGAHYAPRIGFPLLTFGLILFWLLKRHQAPAESGYLSLLVPSMILVWAAAFLL